MTLVLAGVAVSSVFSAGVDAVVTLIPDALTGYSDFRVGGLTNVPMSRLIPAAWVVGAAAGESLDPRRMALASLAGLAVMYAVGMPYMALILNGYMGKGMSVSGLLWAGMLPFLPGDAIKIVITAVLCPLLRRRIGAK